jgi:hypothetical protein
VERFLTLNETGKIVADKAWLLSATGCHDRGASLLRLVICVESAQISTGKGGYERKADLAAAHDHLAEGGGALCELLN